MILKEVLEINELIDRPGKVGKLVMQAFDKYPVKIRLVEIKEKKGSTEFIKITIHGKKIHRPTLGIIGRLGGIGARPDLLGLVSDGDGALAVLSIALKIAKMKQLGDQLEGDVIIATHLCTNAPIVRHNPVPFMGSPVEISTMNKYEVDNKMDAILSIDTSRGNRIINTNDFAITPTVKEGWILKVSEDLLTIMENTTGNLPAVVPITMQDITPYGNGIYHFNSIMQPATTTTVPVVGVAITSEVPVPGSATGVTNAVQIDKVGRFVIEVAQSFSKKKISFYDELEFSKIKKLYGGMKVLNQNPLLIKKNKKI